MSAELCQNCSDQKVTVLHTWAGSHKAWKQCSVWCPGLGSLDSRQVLEQLTEPLLPDSLMPICTLSGAWADLELGSQYYCQSPGTVRPSPFRLCHVTWREVSRTGVVGGDAVLKNLYHPF